MTSASCPVEIGGGLFLVMQFLEGETLAQRLSRGPLSIKETLDVGIQIAEALAAAHRAGIVHRDLKPGNVMLTRAGARLLDFGLARTVSTASGGDSGATVAGDRTALTTQGTLLGTLHYMAPEQLDGREVDTRADIFAFGAVLFEMVTGAQGVRSRDAGAGVERDPARRAGARLDDRAGHADRPRRVDSHLPRQGSERALAGHGRCRAPAAMAAVGLEQRQVGRGRHAAPCRRAARANWRSWWPIAARRSPALALGAAAMWLAAALRQWRRSACTRSCCRRRITI